MLESDFNKASGNSRKQRLVWKVAGVIALVLFTGLAAYTLQLRQQIEDLRQESASETPESLFDSADVEFTSPSQLADPFAHMEAIRSQMDAMVNSMFSGAPPAVSGIPGLSAAPGSTLFGPDPFRSLGLNQPDIFLRETDDTLEVVIPVQHGQQFEISTDVQEDRLTVSGTISWQQESSQNGLSSRRQGSSQFRRTVVLPTNVDPTGMMTEHKDNEIVISLPKG